MPPFEILELGKKILFTGFSVKLVVNQELDEDHVSISTDVYSLATFIDCNSGSKVLSEAVGDLAMLGAVMILQLTSTVICTVICIGIVVALCMEREVAHRVS